MSRILVGVLQPGARLLGVGINSARRGVAMFDGQPRGVIVKNCPPQELAAECFCALLADALSVNSPPVGIVFERKTPLFASIDVQAPNLMQQFCINPDAPNSAELQVLVDELVQGRPLSVSAEYAYLVTRLSLAARDSAHTGKMITVGEA